MVIMQRMCTKKSSCKSQTVNMSGINMRREKKRRVCATANGERVQHTNNSNAIVVTAGLSVASFLLFCSIHWFGKTPLYHFLLILNKKESFFSTPIDCAVISISFSEQKF